MPAGQHATETNQFGMHEFMRLCRLICAEAYSAANVESGTAREFHDWVSYCNASWSLPAHADIRAIWTWLGQRPFLQGCRAAMSGTTHATVYQRPFRQRPVHMRAVFHHRVNLTMKARKQHARSKRASRRMWPNRRSRPSLLSRSGV
jgi:hypothetical protein